MVFRYIIYFIFYSFLLVAIIPSYLHFELHLINQLLEMYKKAFSELLNQLKVNKELRKLNEMQIKEINKLNADKKESIQENNEQLATIGLHLFLPILILFHNSFHLYF